MRLPKVKMLRQLLYWVQERQIVHLKRQNGDPWPWTKDPILQRYRFCCSYREDDKVTKWIRENWREPYKDHPNLWFAMAIARQINWPDALQAMGFPEVWDPRKALRALDKRRNGGEKVFTSAYLIGGGIPKGMAKTRYIIMNVLNPLYRYSLNHRTKIFQNNTLKETWEWLVQFHGWGKFLAYEVITDLRHTRYLCNAIDIKTWANVGPGAERGLNRLYERELRTHQNQAILLEELCTVSEWIEKNRDQSILPTWEARDAEHLFCEFDKMLRVTERQSQNRIVGLERFRHPGLI